MESQKALDTALSAKLPSMLTTVDARVKRQALACQQTQNAISEIELAIKDADSAQMDIEDKPKADNNAPKRR